MHELEIYQVWVHLQSAQKQIDYLRSLTKKDHLVFIVMTAIVLIAANDFFDFLKSYLALSISKSVTYILLLSLMTYIIKNKQAKIDDVIEQIRQEKKSVKKMRKSLTNFDTRIVSHIRASPACFAKIITND